MAVTSFPTLAATNLPAKLKRLGSGRIRKMNDRIPPDGDGSAVPNERTSLLERITTSDSGTPLWKDERAWVRWPMYTLHKTWETLASNPVNVLLVFVPLGIVAGAVGWNPTTVFILNFLAIVPLASLLSFATEELSVKLGQTLGGLMNATFGNAVELIVRLGSSPGSTARMANPSIGQHCRSQEQ